jgi:tetratricopeptide (TPR) repeat protein
MSDSNPQSLGEASFMECYIPYAHLSPSPSHVCLTNTHALCHYHSFYLSPSVSLSPSNTRPAGADHAQVAKTGRRLVSVYKQQNRSADAESLLQRILDLVAGMSEVETIRIVNSIAILQKKQGKLEEAEAMYLRALNTYEQLQLRGASLSVCREDYLSTLNNLGLLYKAKKDFPRSRQYYDAAYTGRKDIFGIHLLSYCLFFVTCSFYFISSHLIIFPSKCLLDL